MSAPQQSKRQYRVQGVIGHGGFGTVYRARLEGPQGFSKDVAVKLLKAANPPREVLQRFRDEARILGLVRDRAVVAVDPPVQLGGRWAVVMEFVDGVSVSRLITTHGSIPAGPALAITAEIARALDKMWTLPGPDGEPLNLLHRDLKPANLQLTAAGEIKVLDFGIAKASFSARETNTTTSISGTAGYMAPERMAGEEGSTTDVFSLGVVLYEMVTGKRPRLEALISEPEEPDPPELAPALELARAMCTIRPDQRPAAREVERRATVSAAQLSPALREWAEIAVPANPSPGDDPLVGSLLTETLLIEDTGAPPPPTRGWLMGGVASLTLVAGALFFALAFVAALLAANLYNNDTAVEVVEVPVRAQPVRIPVKPEPEPVEEPVQVVEPVEEPDSKPPKPTPVRPVPVEVEPATPRPEPLQTPAKTWPVVFASRPPDAVVFIDGRRRGITPLNLQLTKGSHTVRLQSGGKRHNATIDAGFRKPKRYYWNIEADTWSFGK